MDEKILQQRAAEVIRPLIPSDAKERVERSFKQWNQIVREHIRTETGLKLADGDNRLSIPVRIVEGFPLALASLIDRYGDPVLWRLVIGQPKLGGMIEGLQYLLHEWEALRSWRRLPDIAKLGEPSLRHSLEIAIELQRTAATEQVRKEITAIHEDILGTYRYPAGQPSWVELYWMPMAMVAAMLNVKIEDLTLVVLAHELAHGYTHVGRDIDGTRWHDEHFGKTDLRIKEGLAQFYTHVVVERMALRSPGIKDAYTKLLALQSGPYLVHLEWLNGDFRQRGECVRFTMITARTQPPMTYDEWANWLAAINTSLTPK